MNDEGTGKRLRLCNLPKSVLLVNGYVGRILDTSLKFEDFEIIEIQGD